MLKYRSLTPEELATLEVEFKQFLILNELYDAEWRALASAQPEKAQGFIDLFSTIVLEKVYQKAPGLLQIGHDFICVFHLENDPWKLYHFSSKQVALLEGVTEESFIPLLLNNTNTFELHIGTKKSSPHKAAAVHELINQGANILSKDHIQEFLQHFQKD